jgi:hypothetical protein
MLPGGLIFPILLLVILGALDLKSTLSLTLSHKWEREQTQVCSALFAVQSSVPCVTSPSRLPS